MLCFTALPAAGRGAEEEASGPPPPGNAGPPPPSPGTERPKSPPARDFCSALCPALGKAKGTQTDHHQVKESSAWKLGRHNYGCLLQPSVCPAQSWLQQGPSLLRTELILLCSNPLKRQNYPSPPQPFSGTSKAVLNTSQTSLQSPSQPSLKRGFRDFPSFAGGSRARAVGSPRVTFACRREKGGEKAPRPTAHLRMDGDDLQAQRKQTAPTRSNQSAGWAVCIHALGCLNPAAALLR